MGACGEIAALLREVIGFDPDSTGRTTLEHHVKARMKAAGVPDSTAYLERLRNDPAETERLIEDVLVPETWFFRDVEPFRFLGRYIRDSWRAAHPGARLRILSAPCSTGEEPYSIVIALTEAEIEPGEFSVDAVDLSGRALNTARRGRYGRNSFRGSWCSGKRERYFQPEGTEWKLREEIASQVRFSRGNLLEWDFTAGRGPYDVVFCRNLLIYLTADARRKVLAAVDALLAPDGLLFSGHAEALLPVQNGYRPVDHPRSFACWKGMAPVRTSASSLSPARTAPQERRQVPGRVRRTSSLPGCEALLERARALADRGALEAAEDLCAQALRASGVDAEAHCLEGLIRAAAGKLDAAEESLRRALYLRPDHYEALVEMSLLCELKGEPELGGLYRARARRVAEMAERHG